MSVDEHSSVCPSVLPANTGSVEAASAAVRRPTMTASLDFPQSCPNCRRSWGAGRSCQFCRQVEGLPVSIRLSSPGKRLGGWLLEGILVVVTLWIGWLVWSLIVYGQGQTPAKQLLGMRCVTLATGRRAGWGRTFAREFLAKSLIGVLASVTVIGVVAYFWLVWDRDNQELWDKLVGTVVVDDPARLLK
jgi:uncharacterized RDD family membrane protein YckC